MKNRSDTNKSSRAKTAVTLGLFLVWILLISFAFVAAGDPPWLRSLARYGQVDESRGMKDYGDNYLRQKNYRMAIAQYQKALEIKPDYVGALVNLAMAYTNSGNGDQALKILNDALKMESVRPGPVYFNMGEILAGQGKREEAIEYYLKSANSEIEQDLLYQKLAVIYLELGQEEPARKAFEKILEIQTDIKTPYLNMVRTNVALYEDKSEDRMALSRMLNGELKDSDLNKYDLETIRRMNMKDPEIAKTHNFLGKILVAQGDTLKAIEHFQQSLQIWPGNNDAVNQLTAIKTR